MKKFLILVVLLAIIGLIVFYWKPAPAVPESDSAAVINADLQSIMVDDPNSDVDAVSTDIESL